MLLGTVLSSFQTGCCGDDATKCHFFLNPKQLLFASIGISQVGYMLLLQYPLASCASFIFSGVEQKCYLLLKC